MLVKGDEGESEMDETWVDYFLHHSSFCKSQKDVLAVQYVEEGVQVSSLRVNQQ